jgi:hypothetical protein
MALEALRDEMAAQMERRSGSRAQKEKYLVIWEHAMENSGQPLPCPACYLHGRIRRLKSIKEEKGLGIVRCEDCRETFEYPSPETK